MTGVDRRVAPVAEADPLESRPGIVLVGSANVGKRTILSRLLSADLGDAPDSSVGTILCHGWNIDTKYYSVDVTVWTAELDDGFSLGMLPAVNQMEALVLVFDLSDHSSFIALQDWVSGVDIHKFEILLCIGNKADLLPGHFAHIEYRRRLQKRGESSSDPHPEFLDYGILETEGTSLLGDEEPSWEIRKSCLEWCVQHNMEYFEACGSNADFDKCLSIHGDMQGVDRLYGALSAHMWPGMTLKSGSRIAAPFLVEKEEESDEDSEFEVEYEILSGGFDEQWDEKNGSWDAFNKAGAGTSLEKGSSNVDIQMQKPEMTYGNEHHISEMSFISEGFPCDNFHEGAVEKSFPSSSTSDPLQEHEEDGQSLVGREVEISEETSIATQQEDPKVYIPEVAELNGEMHLGYDDLERFMSEIGSMRGSLRFMPDFQRREMAAKLALEMAAMFECSSDDEGIE